MNLSRSPGHHVHVRHRVDHEYEETSRNAQEIEDAVQQAEELVRVHQTTEYERKRDEGEEDRTGVEKVTAR